MQNGNAWREGDYNFKELKGKLSGQEMLNKFFNRHGGVPVTRLRDESDTGWTEWQPYRIIKYISIDEFDGHDVK